MVRINAKNADHGWPLRFRWFAVDSSDSLVVADFAWSSNAIHFQDGRLLTKRVGVMATEDE